MCSSLNGVHAIELFIKTTAVFIGMTIHITTQYCTTAHPLHHHGMIQMMKIMIMQS